LGARQARANTRRQVYEENDSVGLNIETEHRTATIAFRVHLHRLAQPPPDLPKEAAEHIDSILALQLPQVDVEVDFIVGTESEERQHGRPVLPAVQRNSRTLPCNRRSSSRRTNALLFPLTKDTGAAPPHEYLVAGLASALRSGALEARKAAEADEITAPVVPAEPERTNVTSLPSTRYVACSGADRPGPVPRTDRSSRPGPDAVRGFSPNC
jgi:hypothetical protein